MSAQVKSMQSVKTDVVDAVAPGLHSPPDSTTKHDDSDSELSELDDALDEEPTADFMGTKTEPEPEISMTFIAEVPSIDTDTKDSIESQPAVDDEIIPDQTTQSMELDPVDTIEEVKPEAIEPEIIEPFEFDGGVPVFRPSDEDFEEPFESYVGSITSYSSAKLIFECDVDEESSQLLGYADWHCKGYSTTRMGQETTSTQRNYKDNSGTPANLTGNSRQ